MTSIKINAFVHPIDSKASGFIYATITADMTTFVRLSSVKGKGEIMSLIEFSTEAKMLEEAKNQCRINADLVLADEKTVGTINMTSLEMLLNTVKSHHPYLFSTDLQASQC